MCKKKTPVIRKKQATLDGVKFSVGGIDDVRIGTLKAFRSKALVSLGFNRKTTDNIIEHVVYMATAKKGKELVGTACIKIPVEDYFNRVFLSTNIDKYSECFGYEIGYIWTDEKYRKLGVASKLSEMVMAYSTKLLDKRVYATSRYDNLASHKVLTKIGLITGAEATEKTGAPFLDWRNHKSQSVLRTFIDGVPTEKEMNAKSPKGLAGRCYDAVKGIVTGR